MNGKQNCGEKMRAALFWIVALFLMDAECSSQVFRVVSLSDIHLNTGASASCMSGHAGKRSICVALRCVCVVCCNLQITQNPHWHS